MPPTSASAAAPPPPSRSALSHHLASHPSPLPPSNASDSPLHHNLAHQILYDLAHGHSWSDLHVHTQSPLPRPLISGLPPRRLYVHPDDQIEELKRTAQRRGARGDGRRKGGGEEDEEDDPEEDVKVEREWVLPTHLREKWSLRRLGEVFDVVEEEPPDSPQDQGVGREEKSYETDREMTDGGSAVGKTEVGKRKRRGGKRVLLAILGDDSTVAYYIVHDGIVKPRQN